METTPQIVELLRQIPLFSELDEAALTRLADWCVTRTFGSAELLFRAGESPRGLYVVRSGRVRVFRTNHEGKEQVIVVEGPGRAVAELPLIDGSPYPASAITLEESRLVFVPRPDFQHLYRSSPDVADALLRGLGKRLRHLVQLVETLAFRDVAARLAMLLAEYADRVGTETPNGVELQLGRTHEELALEIGTARESVGRALRQLRERGLIEPIGTDTLRIADIGALRAMARGE